MSLLFVRRESYSQEDPTVEKILSWFKSADAYWMYEGEPSADRAHVELTSGLCSNGYFDCPKLFSFPEIAEILGRKLARELRVADIGRVDLVVSSAYSGIIFGHEVAKALRARFINVEKDPKDPNQKKMICKREIAEWARVLQVEELITTLQTTNNVREAVLRTNPDIEILPVVGALVYRPPDLMADPGVKIVRVIEKEIWAKRPEECPLCIVGSPRYRPKGQNWAKLVS